MFRERTKNLQKNKSLIYNFLFNFLKTVSNVLYPVITFSYSAKILGVDGVGKVNFSKSFILYFCMIAMLGMNYYGTREAAKLRGDKKKLSKYVHEMLIINFVSTEVAYLIFLILLLLIPKLQEYMFLLLINSISILLTGMGMEWLYQAMEEYRYIAIRSMLFQIIAVCMMMLMVRSKDDLYIYACIMVFASSGSYILNFINSRKYIEFKWYGDYEIKKHLVPILWLFAMAVSIEFYTVLDSTMLGLLKGDEEVGLYTAAVRINKIVNTLITSFGVVLIPRLSNYIGKGEKNNLEDLIEKAYHFTFLFSVPACIGLYMLSDDIILFFSGKDFWKAAYTMRLLTPIVVVIPFSVVTNLQIFVPMKKEKLILRSTCAGAITNFICNMLLVPELSEDGAAVATVIAETVVTVICYVNVRKYLKLSSIFKGYHQYWLAAIPILFIGYGTTKFMEHGALRICVVTITSSCCYFAVLFIQKNQYVLEVRDKMIKAIIQRREPSQ